MKTDIIYKYFPDLTDLQKKQIEQLYDLYVDWNSKINVISRKDIDLLYEHHVLHSMSIAKVISFKPNTFVLDVGTGGGFPGIPLAILFPEVNFCLVDSIGKKIKVVRAVAEGIGLTNVTAIHSRVEDIDEEFDFVVGRAIKDLKVFYGWVKNKICKKSFNDLKNGIIYIKGGDVAKEIKPLNLRNKVYPIPDFFEEDYFETKNVVHLYKNYR